LPALCDRRPGGGEDCRKADAADLAALMAESLVDLILRVPEDEQAQLVAHTLTALGDLFLQKSGVADGGSESTRYQARH
jgi:hypothetical protein